MIVELLIANWRVVLLAVLIGTNVLTYELWQSDKSELAYDAAQSKALSEQAFKEKAAADAEHAANLRKITDEYESNLPTVRNDAVSAYLAHHPRVVSDGVLPGSSSSSSVSITGSGIKVDDGAGRECIPDQTFIEDAAECESRLGAWQRYGQLNHIPVE